MKPSRALGKGLGALLGGEDEGDITTLEGDILVRELSIGDIDPNREQPRKRFGGPELDALAESIKNVGVIQPILVMKQGVRFTIIAGERRWRAARLAGLTAIPAIVREVDNVRRMEIALIENLQRENLNPVEEAQAVRALMEECGLTQELVAGRLGRSRPAVANLLRLLHLPKAILILIEEGKLSAGHARALVALEEETKQIEIAEKAVAQGWSVRETERALARLARDKDESPSVTPQEFSDLERLVREVLGMRVKINGTTQKGTVQLSYGSMEELQSLFEILEHAWET